MFTDPQVATVGTTEGDKLVTARYEPDRGREAVDLRAAEASGPASSSRPIRSGASSSAQSRSARRRASGSVSSRWRCGRRSPLDVLLDTIQPYPTFSEAIFSALLELENRLGASLALA